MDTSRRGALATLGIAALAATTVGTLATPAYAQTGSDRVKIVDTHQKSDGSATLNAEITKGVFKGGPLNLTISAKMQATIDNMMDDEGTGKEWDITFENGELTDASRTTGADKK